jgi:hypothetical protein
MIIQGKVTAWEVELRDSVFGGLDAEIHPAAPDFWPAPWSSCTIHVPEGTAAAGMRAARKTVRETEAEMVARAVCTGVGGKWLRPKRIP